MCVEWVLGQLVFIEVGLGLSDDIEDVLECEEEDKEDEKSIIMFGQY